MQKDVLDGTPFLMLMLILGVTTGLVKPWPECQLEATPTLGPGQFPRSCSSKSLLAQGIARGIGQLHQRRSTHTETSGNMATCDSWSPSM